jgi:hypothetical protein
MEESPYLGFLPHKNVNHDRGPSARLGSKSSSVLLELISPPEELGRRLVYGARGAGGSLLLVSLALMLLILFLAWFLSEIQISVLTVSAASQAPVTCRFAG